MIYCALIKMCESFTFDCPESPPTGWIPGGNPTCPSFMYRLCFAASPRTTTGRTIRLKHILVHAGSSSQVPTVIWSMCAVSQTYNCAGQHLTPHGHVCIPHLHEMQASGDTWAPVAPWEHESYAPALRVQLSLKLIPHFRFHRKQFWRSVSSRVTDWAHILPERYRFICVRTESIWKSDPSFCPCRLPTDKKGLWKEEGRKGK